MDSCDVVNSEDDKRCSMLYLLLRNKGNYLLEYKKCFQKFH